MQKFDTSAPDTGSELSSGIKAPVVDMSNALLDSFCGVKPKSAVSFTLKLTDRLLMRLFKTAKIDEISKDASRRTSNPTTEKSVSKWIGFWLLNQFCPVEFYWLIDKCIHLWWLY